MYLVLTASPNQEGLTAACGKAAAKGISDMGGTVESYDLCREKIKGCRVCGDGWGICRTESRCVIDDPMQMLKDKMAKADGLFLITPVYWAQQSEIMKYFCDRVRRCEAIKFEKSALYGKRINLIAAAGGSGNGTVSCLTDMELWAKHVGAIPVQRIGIDRFNRETMMKVIERAGRDMVSFTT